MYDKDKGVGKNNYEIDLRELLSIVWAGKLMIFAISIVFAFGSVVFALSVPNQYKATALVAPSQSDGSGLSGALGQLQGITSLVGVSIGGGESSESQIAQEIMKSWSFIEAFITENNLEVEIYAAKGWNRESNELLIDNDIYDPVLNAWLLEADENNESRPPTSWELFDKFGEMISISEDKKSGLVSISLEYYSPQVAKQWLDMYIASINKHMQARQVAKVSNNIAYLEAQIDKTSIAEMREVFYTIIEEQTKNRMVAEASPDYAFMTVSPSMVPEEKSRPQRALICVLGTLIGGMLSVLLVILIHYTKSSSGN